MERLTHSLSFYCRSSKVSKKTGLAPIELSIVINGERVFINLPRKEYPDVFKKSVQSKRNNPVKDFIEEVRNKFNTIELEMMKNNIPLTSENLKKYFRTGGVKTYTVGDMFDEYFKLLEKRVDVNLTFEAYKNYLKARNCFYNYVPAETELSTVTPAQIENFKAELDSKYQPQTVKGIITKIKTVFIFAKENGKININPFINIKYHKINNDIEYLTEEEINKIKTKVIENERLSKIRDLAVFMISSGLSYTDLSKLQKEDFQFKDDTCFIYKQRQKTGIDYFSVILPDGVEVLKKYNYCLPIISNQKLNNYLKEIQTICNINKNLHCHLFRKTYGTLLLNKGVRLEVVSKCLGHSNTRITQQIYAKLQNNTILNEVAKAF